MSIWQTIFRVFEGFLWSKNEHGKNTSALPEATVSNQGNAASTDDDAVEELLAQSASPTGLGLGLGSSDKEEEEIEILSHSAHSDDDKQEQVQLDTDNETGLEESKVESEPEIEIEIGEAPEKEKESVGVVVIDDPDMLSLLEEDDEAEEPAAPTQGVEAFEGADPVLRAKELAKDAVKQKNADIKKAVKMMEEVVRLHRTDSYLARLSYYYSLSGNWRSALAIQTERLNSLEPSDVWNYFHQRAGMLDDTRKIHSRHDDLERAVYFELESSFAKLCASACRGKLNEDLFSQPIEGKTLEKELKKAKRKPELHDKIEAAFKDFLQEKEAELRAVVSAVNVHRKLGLEKRKAKISADDQVLEPYTRLRETDFEKFFSNQIKEALAAVE